MKFDITEVLTEIINFILDSLSECFQTVTIPSGKRLLHVLGIAFVFLGISIVLDIFDFEPFISKAEAGVAIGILVVLNLVNNINKAFIMKVKSSLRRSRNNYENRQ